MTPSARMETNPCVRRHGEIMRKTTLALLFAAVMALCIVQPASAQVGGRVAVIGADNAPALTDVAAKILADGRFTAVDVINAQVVTPSLATLQTYRAVLVYENFGYGNRISLGNNLDAYVRAGGGVVTAAFETTTTNGLQGAWASGGNRVIASGFASNSALLGTIAVPGHPTVAGVTSFNGGTNAYRSNGAITAGSTLIARWSTGEPLIAFKPVGLGTVAAVNFFPPSSDVSNNYWVSSTQGGRLMANALVFAGSYVAPVPVPTLSEWAMILFGTLLAGWAALNIQRRQMTV